MQYIWLRHLDNIWTYKTNSPLYFFCRQSIKRKSTSGRIIGTGNKAICFFVIDIPFQAKVKVTKPAGMHDFAILNLAKLRHFSVEETKGTFETSNSTCNESFQAFYVSRIIRRLRVRFWLKKHQRKIDPYIAPNPAVK